MGFARISDGIGIAVACLVALCLVALCLAGPRAAAQDAPAAAAPAASPGADASAVTPTRKVVPKRRPHVVKPRKAEAPKPAEPAAAPQTATATEPAKNAADKTDPAKPTAAATPNLFDEQFLKAGATTCAGSVSELAAASMQGVTSVGTASNWFKAAPDRRPVSLLLGQKFGPKGVPYGATGVFAAPRADGTCDALSIQVVPSALPCAKLRETLAARGKQLADLAGVPLMQDAAGQTMLVPTGAGTCVLVGLRAAYAK